MSRTRKIKRNHMRALISEVTPFEAPLPFGTLGIFRFLRKIDFQWTDQPNAFSVSTEKCGPADVWRLRTLFDGTQITGSVEGAGRTKYVVSNGEFPRTVLPYRFSTKQNNGKIRELTVLHPQSMIEVSRFIHDYADSILYFTNRSAFSIRHPARVAAVEMKRDGVFEQNRDRETLDIEQHNLEYDHVTTYFTYRRYTHISRFYGSAEFQACERKYPALLRADVSNCFPSIYTHTMSWVTNGIHVSKGRRTQRATNETFGGRFDKLVQNLNYAETSGIVIGPEFSRIFAEIILQEVDVHVERDLREAGLIYGVHYEAMRYVDDFFFFLKDPGDVDLVESVLARHLAHFKLHLNERKKELLTTPLKSEASVAKHRIYVDLKRLTRHKRDPDLSEFGLSFDSGKAILEYKSVLIDAELSHGDLANYYLYSLIRRAGKVVKRSRKYLSDLPAQTDKAKQTEIVGKAVTKCLSGMLDVAFFIYAGAPSPSHGIKLTQLILTSIRDLEDFDITWLDRKSFGDKVRRELLAQVLTAGDRGRFGIHALNLLDCYVHLGGELTGLELKGLVEQRGLSVETLEVFEVLVLLRACGTRDDASEMRSALLERADSMIKQGNETPEFRTSRAILLLSLSEHPGLTESEIRKLTGLDRNEVKLVRDSTGASMFSWDIDAHYLERVLLKSSRVVY